MATKKVVQELITKWKYQVDATQIKKTAMAIKNLKKNFSEVRKSSVAFGKGEFARIRRIRQGWQGLNSQVSGYRRNLERTTATRGGGRGRGGRASLAQSGAFLAGRLAGSTALTSALLGGPGLAAGFGIGAATRQAGRREQAQVGFTGLLGGKGKGEASASDMMDRINQFAVETPFQISDLRDLSREALGGGFDKEEVLPMLGMLGDATQGRLPELRRLLTNMVEIRNTQRASLRDIRQFGRAGIPIYEALSETLGVSGEKLGNMISDRKIGLKEVTAALKLLTSEGGRFYNLMIDQMSTLIGKTSNLGDAFEILGEKVGKSFLDPAKGAIDSLMESIKAATPHLENFTHGLVKVVTYFKNILMTVAVGVSAAFALMYIKIATVMGIVALLFLIIEDIGTGLKGGDSYFKDFLDAMTEFGEMKWFDGMLEQLSRVKNYMGWITNWIGSTAAGKAIASSAGFMSQLLTSGLNAPGGSGFIPPGVGMGGGFNMGDVNSSVNIKVGSTDEIPGAVDGASGNATGIVNKLARPAKPNNN